MPYSSNDELPSSVRSKYSDKCQRAYRHAFNSVHSDTHDEGRAAAAGHSAAQKCEGKSMNPDLVKTNQRFTLGFVPVLKAALGADGKKRLSGIASSTIQDRHGDTMSKSALDDMLAQAQRGLTIFLNHSYDVPEDVAGTVERASLKQATGDIHDLSMDIIINENNERAVKAWEAIHDQGIQLGLSIGGMIPDGGARIDRKTGTYQIDHVDLVETSIVGVPANPRSWVEYATKALRKQESGELEPLTMTTSSWVSTTDFSGTASDNLLRWSAGDPEKPVDPDAEDAEAPDETNVEPPAEAPAEAPAEPPAEAEKSASVEEILNLASASAPLQTTTEPDAKDATVTVETPFANITVDTGRRDPSAGASATSQEAPDGAAPETEESAKEAPPPWLGIPGNPPVQQAIDPMTFLQRELTQSASLITKLSSELSEARGALDTERSLRTTAERERDAASADLTRVLRQTKELLDKLAATPVGRRTTYHEAVGRYEAIKATYGDELTDHLARSINT
jgi:HK97 family phage prohead protease